MFRDFGGKVRSSQWLWRLGVLAAMLCGASRGVQAVESGRYVLDKTETDFENKNRGAVNVGGAVRITETTFQRDVHEVGNDGRLLDLHAKWTFEAPPKELSPGQEFSLKVSGTCTSADQPNSMLSTAMYYASDPEMWLSGKTAKIGKMWDQQPGWVPEATETTRYIVPLGPLPVADVGKAKPIYAQILSIELNVDTHVFTTYHYRWEEKSEGLDAVVGRVLHAFAKKKHPVADLPPTLRQPRYFTVGWTAGTAPPLHQLDYTAADDDAQLQLIGNSFPSWLDILRTNTVGDMSNQEAAELAPDLAIILNASVQKPLELRDVLLHYLYSPGAENTQVFRLVMGGMGNSVIFNNLSKTLSPNDKLLRYARGRDRFCRQNQQRDYEAFMLDCKLAAAMFFSTVDLTLSLCDIPVIQGTSLVLSYVQIYQRIAEKDPTLNETLPMDVTKLARDVAMARPQMHPEFTGPFSYAMALSDYYDAREAWKDKWPNDPNRNLSEETIEKLDAVPTEGAWLDCLDHTREEYGRTYVFNRAVRGAFDAIFEQNHWELEPLTFYNSAEHKEHVEARHEVMRRMTEARTRIPATAYYGGWVEPNALPTN